MFTYDRAKFLARIIINIIYSKHQKKLYTKGKNSIDHQTQFVSFKESVRKNFGNIFYIFFFYYFNFKKLVIKQFENKNQGNLLKSI